MQTIHGSCHCGNINFEFATPDPLDQLVMRACQCSFCRKHGAVTSRDPRGDARIEAREVNKINLYRFATKSTDFVLCAVCGAYVGAVLPEDGKLYATLNMRLTTLSLDRVEPIVYDDEPTAKRVSRRKALFTPVSHCNFLQG